MLLEKAHIDIAVGRLQLDKTSGNKDRSRPAMSSSGSSGSPLWLSSACEALSVMPESSVGTCLLDGH
jgi:hypothetical protein